MWILLLVAGAFAGALLVALAFVRAAATPCRWCDETPYKIEPSREVFAQ